jgi:predicted O-methyltransferase YrrM
MLEIGTANWFSSINFWIELQELWWKLWTIEFSPNSFEDARKNIVEAKLEDTIIQILGNALDEIPKFEDNFFDFVFIDWMKKRSKDFLELCLPKTKTWGIIIIDDVIKFKEKMTGLWECLEEKNIEYNILPIDGDDWILMLIKE